VRSPDAADYVDAYVHCYRGRGFARRHSDLDSAADEYADSGAAYSDANGDADATAS